MGSYWPDSDWPIGNLLRKLLHFGGGKTPWSIFSEYLLAESVVIRPSFLQIQVQFEAFGPDVKNKWSNWEISNFQVQVGSSQVM